MIRMQIQFTDEQAQALKRVAAERDVSIAAIAREAVDRLLIESGVTTTDEGRAAALAIMGKFRSDQPDVAREHDRYLADAYGQRG